MVYKTIITERADELLEQLIYYLAYRLKSECETFFLKAQEGS